jgi:glycosyltransferase involved in cell wall biosynthesis
MPVRTTVVLCTYDGETFVADQAASLLAQTRPLDEIVVSDDASTDASPARVREALAGFGGNLRLHVNPVTLGVVRNFEHALRLAQGDLCFLCDQDDVWRADKVRQMVAAFERKPEILLLHSDARIIDESGRRTGATLFRELRIRARDLAACDAGDALSVLLRRNIVTGATVAVRRELLEIALPIQEGYWHDEWLALIAAAVGSIGRIDEPLIDYRIHRGNQAGVRGVMPALRLRAALSARGTFHTDRARKLDALLERLRRLGARVPLERLRLVEACRDHWSVRANLPRRRIGRVPLILAEWRGERYRRFSNGWRGAVRDLLEPLP